MLQLYIFIFKKVFVVFMNNCLSIYWCFLIVSKIRSYSSLFRKFFITKIGTEGSFSFARTRSSKTALVITTSASLGIWSIEQLLISKSSIAFLAFVRKIDKPIALDPIPRSEEHTSE